MTKLSPGTRVAYGSEEAQRVDLSIALGRCREENERLRKQLETAQNELDTARNYIYELITPRANG